MFIGLAGLVSIGYAGAAPVIEPPKVANSSGQEHADWRPGFDAFPMWLHCDISTRGDMNKAPAQKHFNAVWRINGEFDRLSYGYVYGELDGHSRSNLDVLSKELMDNLVQSPSDILNRTQSDVDFNSFVPGSDNGWHSIPGRRVSFDTNLDNKPRHFEVLILTDGNSRVWTFAVNYSAGFSEGPAIAKRLLDSIQIMNKIDVGDASNHYRASISRGGRIRRDVSGSFLQG